MNNLKNRELQQWLAANPGKTEKDYLLEIRCPNDDTRLAVKKLLEALEEHGIKFGLFVELKNYENKYQHAPLNRIESTCFDIMIAPGTPKNSWLIEVDMPDKVLGKQIHSQEGSIPEEAFIWLLEKWFPDFNIEAYDEKQLNTLMWKDMGGYICKVIGNRGFPQWKKPEFVKNVIETYERYK